MKTQTERAALTGEVRPGFDLGERPSQEAARGQSGELNAAMGAAGLGFGGAGQALPHLEAIQASFGRHDVQGVEAHTGEAAARAARGLGAEAYTVGERVVFGLEPDLRLAAHEAAHVIQQRGGARPSGGVGQAGDELEQQAEAVALAVVEGRSAEGLLDRFGGGGAATEAVQMWESPEDLDAGVAPPPADSDMGVEEQSAEEGAEDLQACMDRLGAKLEFRSAGIASPQELEAYQAQCEAEAKAAFEASELAERLVWKNVDRTFNVAFTVVGGAIGAVTSISLGANRIGRVIWSVGTFDANTLVNIGEEHAEIYNFITTKITLDASEGFIHQFKDEDGGLSLMLKAFIEAELQSALAALSEEQVEQFLRSYRAEQGEASGLGDIDKLIQSKATQLMLKKVGSNLLTSQAIKPIILGGIEAAIQMFLGSDLAAGLGTAGATAETGLGIVLFGLTILGFAEKVAPARRELQATYPAVFKIATDHNMGFMWHFIKPSLPELRSEISQLIKKHISK